LLLIDMSDKTTILYKLYELFYIYGTNKIIRENVINNYVNKNWA